MGQLPQTKLPQTKGHLLTGLVAQDFYWQGNLENEAHVIFFKVDGARSWHRCFADGPQLYCQEVEQPDQIGIVNDEIEYRLRDLGQELRLVGVTLTGLQRDVSNGLPSLSLNFVDGRQIIFRGDSQSGGSWSGYDLAVWEVSE